MKSRVQYLIWEGSRAPDPDSSTASSAPITALAARSVARMKIRKGILYPYYDMTTPHVPFLHFADALLRFPQVKNGRLPTRDEVEEN